MCDTQAPLDEERLVTTSVQGDMWPLRLDLQSPASMSYVFSILLTLCCRGHQAVERAMDSENASTDEA